MTDAFDQPADPSIAARLSDGAQAATAAVPLDQDPRFQIPLFLALGIFCGLVLGLLGFNAANSFGPTTTETATINSFDLVTNQDNPSDPLTYYVVGVTESGKAWKFPSEAAYDLASQQGFAMQVEVTFSDITGTAVGLQVGDIDETLTGTANRIFFTATTLLALLGIVIGAWFLRKQGMAVIVPFVTGVMPIGSWLGYIAMRAWRGG